jgi:hypothetical protein
MSHAQIIQAFLEILRKNRQCYLVAKTDPSNGAFNTKPHISTQVGNPSPIEKKACVDIYTDWTGQNQVFTQISISIF